MDNTNQNGDKKVNIAFVLLSLSDTGGSERVVFDLVRKMDRTLFAIIIISFHDGPLRKIYESIGVKVHIITKTIKYDLFFILKLKKVFIKESIEIVNPHHFTPVFFSFLASIGSNIKFVYTEHSKWQLTQLGFINKLINKKILNSADAVVAISNQIESYLIDEIKIGGKNVHLITNGIDIDRYCCKKNKESSRKRFGIDSSDFVIGVVANLRPEKNHKFLISTFSAMSRKFLNLKLVLVGLDRMNGEIQKFAAESSAYDRILFLGMQKDIPDVLSTFDVFCLPSLYEGLPLSILEAMAAGIPVVGSDVMGINEVINNGQNGLLFPLGDAPMLSKALEYLIKDKDLRDKLCTSAKKYVNENYFLDDKVTEYQKLFFTLLK